MSKIRTLVFGVGKRVVETALPAFHRADDRFEIAAVFARSARTLTIDGREHRVRAVNELSAADVGNADLIYIAVGKSAVRDVARRLRAFDVSKHSLLIDTPVVTLKQLDVVRDLERFGRTSVAEDCIALPWYDAIAELARGALGELRSVRFDRSAYKYHGNAMAKTLLRAGEVVTATVSRVGNGVERSFAFENGKTAVIVEPRDYAIGHVRCDGAAACVDDVHSDSATTRDGKRRIVLSPWLDGERCVGVRAGDVEVRLDAAEASLMSVRPSAASVTARMEDWKRVGFLRLLRRMGRGESAYPLAAGLDDMLVDWNLERFGRYSNRGMLAPRTFMVASVLPTVTRWIGRG